MSAPLILAIKPAEWAVQSGGLWRSAAQDRGPHELLALGGLATAGVLLLWLISRVQGRMAVTQAPRRPGRVFRALLRHHGLRLSDRVLLSMIVRHRRLEQPAVLLLSPMLFSCHATGWLAEARLASFWPSPKERLARIAQEVFENPQRASGVSVRAE